VSGENLKGNKEEEGARVRAYQGKAHKSAISIGSTLYYKISIVTRRK
jgi:hypothetical protein